MGSWSTTAPSGITWGSWMDGYYAKPNYVMYRCRSRIGRGAKNAIYIHERLEALCYDWNAAPFTVTMRGSVSVGNTSSYLNSNEYSEVIYYSPDAYTTVRDIYYTGTAAKGTKVYVRCWGPGAGWTEGKAHTAPDYTTKYTVAYNANGGSGAPSSQQKTYATALTLSTTKPTKSGNAFSKWNTKADGSGTSYAAGASYTVNDDVTLYAQWVPDTYAVSYNANGGSGTTAGQTKTYGTALTLRANGFTKTGHSFVKWNTKADGSGTSYSAGGRYTANAAVTLYAIWTPDTYAVTYDANEGTGTTQAQTKTHGTALTLRANGYTRKGWDFTGWNTEADGSGTAYAAGAAYTANEAVTLYAQWVKRNIPVYVNDGGQIRQAEKAYRNVDGQIRECKVYINDGSGIRAVE